jgi:DNA-binding transcriptional ArsR family regulator
VADSSEDDSSNLLKGTALGIYRLLLTSRRPLSVREIQHALNLSSPSVAQYHLSKLEQAGLLKREASKYVINKVVLENCVKVNCFLIPRYLFYSIFMGVILLIELLVLRPLIINHEYLFYTAVTFLALLIFCYETMRIWIKGRF